ncbi:hypothetical protein GCK72_025352 [Caenorhabditis remanei]|uniref:EndoU domain-containing protein n=1 Tax=Caenorhabditis remanei TaxID=31234 RepID=A0A6A5G2I3_CAERE|nr:hypothetical protein GCK72_025352 [Caenorhabditis remanei]KAF1748885.1 hypothetical protein GCK72_025352 [Caenorhabditis remanei]
MMILRNCALILAAVALVYTKPVQNVDLAAVNTFLTNLAATDVRTDSMVTLSYQNMASKKNPDHDNAKDPLFTSVDASVYGSATYIVIADLLPFFQFDCDQPIPTSNSGYLDAVDSFLTNYINSDAVKAAWTFLQAQGVSTNDATAFRTQLKNLWFTPYARNSVLGSNGFKSVFVGEASGTVMNRFANWFGFYIQENSKTFDYHGWFTKLNVSALFQFDSCLAFTDIEK